jgi:hypothetical protein
MAIIFLFNVMVVRKGEVETMYPGGLAQFRSDWVVRPGHWRDDEHLLAYSSKGFEFKGCGRTAEGSGSRGTSYGRVGATRGEYEAPWLARLGRLRATRNQIA